MHIMLVEDEDALRSSIETLLEMEGHTVSTAADAGHARAVAARLDDPPDLLLTDIVLPDESGIDLGRELRREHWRDLKLLYISGYSAEVVEEYGDVTGRGERFLPKPVPPEQLLETIESFDWDVPPRDAE